MVSLNRLEKGLSAQSNSLSLSSSRRTTVVWDGDDFSIFTRRQKLCIIIAVAIAAFSSPLSNIIYYPVMQTMANDLHVSTFKIALTVTVFLVVQGLAPMLTADFSDAFGRRPAYIICALVFIASNLGLALVHDYNVLLALRIVQSAGSSGTVALASGVVADLAVPAERGTFISAVFLTVMLGPMISPAVGGALTQCLGWHSIFWFLLIFSVVVFVPLILFLPETSRRVVGNGSIAPPALNWSLTDVLLRRQRRRRSSVGDSNDLKNHLRALPRPTAVNPLKTVAVLFNPLAGPVVLATGLPVAFYYALAASMPVQLERDYPLNDLHVSLLLLPMGLGAVVASMLIGRMVDWNFQRHARKTGFLLLNNRTQDFSRFPLERARLEVAGPLMALSAAMLVIYAWFAVAQFHLALLIIILIILGGALIASHQVMNVLLIDLYPTRPAAASAANNFVRCELGAAAAAAVFPLASIVDYGWALTIFAAIIAAFLPVLFVVMKRGSAARRKAAERPTSRLPPPPLKIDTSSFPRPPAPVRTHTSSTIRWSAEPDQLPMLTPTAPASPKSPIYNDIGLAELAKLAELADAELAKTEIEVARMNQRISAGSTRTGSVCPPMPARSPRPSCQLEIRTPIPESWDGESSTSVNQTSIPRKSSSIIKIYQPSVQDFAEQSEKPEPS